MIKQKGSHLLRQVFNGDFAKRDAIGSNMLLMLMYKLAYPFALLLSALGFSPNQITTMSIIASLASSLVLVIDDGWGLFLILWGLAILLDFCDGTVARKTNQLRKTSFRYDHTSDLLKISMVILAAGVKYDDQIVWSTAIISLFFFMLYVVLNHDLSSARKRCDAGDERTSKKPNKSVLYQTRFKKVSRILFTVLTTINGHTLLVFLVLPFGVSWALIGLSYLALISLLRSGYCINKLRNLPK